MKLHKTVSPEASLRLVVILVYLAIYIRNHDPVTKSCLLNNMENLNVFHVFFLIIIPFTHKTFFTFLYSPFGVQCKSTHRE